VNLSERAQHLKLQRPQLIAELTLYPAEQSGRTLPIPPGYGCPCSSDRSTRETWDGSPLLGDEPMVLGETRTVGFVFLSGAEAVKALAAKQTFFLWEGRFIGEARILEVVDGSQ
jgi:hypothetical protein